jgi:ammonia channel protein AmtB
MYHLGPEHIEYAALGVLILWTTWFAFNCGSTESIAGMMLILQSFNCENANAVISPIP